MSRVGSRGRHAGCRPKKIFKGGEKAVTYTREELMNSGDYY